MIGKVGEVLDVGVEEDAAVERAEVAGEGVGDGLGAVGSGNGAGGDGPAGGVAGGG